MAVKEFLYRLQKYEAVFKRGRFWALVALFILIPLMLAWGMLFLRTVTPTAGALDLPVPRKILPTFHQSSIIQIQRDDHGIASVHSRQKKLPYFGLGWIHAQDRLWQMELYRLAAQGRLSTIFGQKLTSADRFFLTLGLQEYAQKSWQQLSSEKKDLVQRYITGINSYIRKYYDRLSPEFLLYNHRPRSWQGEDVFAILYLFHWQNKNPLRQKLISHYLREKAGQSRFDEHPKLLQKLLDFLQQSKTPQTLAANEEVIAFHTLDNGILLTQSKNSPSSISLVLRDELQRIPGRWYLASIAARNKRIAGITIPGVPIFWAGSNGHLFWGLNWGSYKYKGKSYPHTQILPLKQTDSNIQKEAKEIRLGQGSDAKSLPVSVQKTSKGPVITSAFNYLPELIKLEKKYILSWQGLKINQEFSLHHKISSSKNLDQWCQALNQHPHYAAATFFALDGHGNTSLYTNHRHFVPTERSLADSFHGCSKNKYIFTRDLLITPANQKYSNNQDIKQERDHSNNNQKEKKEDSKAVVNHFSSWRGYKRHNQIFASNLHPTSQKRAPVWRRLIFDNISNDDLALSRMLKKHLDDVSKRPKTFGKDYFALFARKNPALVEQAILALQNWDGSYDKTSLAAGIIHRFKVAFLRNILYDKLGELLTDEILKLESTTEKLFYSFFHLGQNNPEHPSFDRRRTKQEEIFADTVRLSLYDAFFYWKKNVSHAVRKWQWGRIHVIRPSHPLAQNFLGRWIFLPKALEESGHSSALWNMQLNPLNKKRIHSGPSIILHSQNPDQLAALMLFGQSGNPASDHYSDFISNWQKREFITLDLHDHSDQELTLHLKADDNLTVEDF